jgi:hypothetical protein
MFELGSENARWFWQWPWGYREVNRTEWLNQAVCPEPSHLPRVAGPTTGPLDTAPIVAMDGACMTDPLNPCRPWRGAGVE